MYRFIALSWDPENRAAAQRSESMGDTLRTSDWTPVLSSSGLLLFHTGYDDGLFQAYPLNAQSAVLGRLFKLSAKVLQLNGNESDALLANNGETLLRQYWGSYIAFFSNEEQQRLNVLRSPSGEIPCFYTCQHGITLYFSDMEDCAQFEDFDFSVNWTQIEDYLIYPGRNLPTTGLAEVRRLLPGHRVSMHKGQITEVIDLWNPVSIALQPPITCAEEAQEALRQTTIDCVAAWASCAEGVLLDLSGGLDSSIVLGCLQNEANATPCFAATYYSDFTDSDERLYARAACDFAGADLIEKHVQPMDLDIDALLNSRITADPKDFHFPSSVVSFQAELARQHKCNLLMTGNGGDEVFQNTDAPYALIDHCLRPHSERKLFRTLFDTARLSKQSLYSTFLFLCRHYYLKHRIDLLSKIYPTDRFPMVNPALQASPILQSSWALLAEEQVLPPAKSMHLFFMDTPRVEATTNTITRIDPLLSQPIIELCLRIPSDLMLANGKKRGLARRAFIADVAPEILARESKGSAGGFDDSKYQKNSQLIRSYLLDGILVERGLLQRSPLENALLPDGDRSSMYINFGMFHCYLSLELWLRSWLSRTGLGGGT